MKRILSVSICLCVAFMTLSCSNQNYGNQYQTIEGYGQGGTYTVKYEPVSGCPDKQTIANGIDSIFQAIDESISLFEDKSLIVRYNNGEAVTADKIFLENRAFADSMVVLTKSVINYKKARLIQLWINAISEKKLPSQEAIAAAKNDTTQFTFNAIGQGYTADVIAKYLKSYGIVNFLVSNSGELSSFGVNEEGKGWLIGVEAPDTSSTSKKKVLGYIRLPKDKETGVSSSGHYRQYATVGSEKFSHVIDLEKGRPVSWVVLSATVIADNATLADALSSYCMIVGHEKAISVLDSLPGVEGCVMDYDGKVYTTAGFQFE